ncbi:hypothetical protein EMIHUDRAFT_231298 [Emiliania huxleyi CCMP1516]|uniref:Uncharacterized protein n=2 Tax=Emiliania huxleyi TaxID=2903 RepID=A0A0D3K7X6_EMIH1|nr:hypothetical protein EMIHUDRAFT_231298 [Emiliania huxleyi CCMP1516]EOD31861.1 hypothetical protein EMIHUDRAFT_231298 [Emiliania huxleyi CCMP1516]|eukprot:XP_005784290.1 hypothetical protein EMIHUDRAFT_231298 [Emiliania huxleyi CCMP1516]
MHRGQAGLATPLALAVKQLGSPSDDEIERLEEFVDESLYQGSSARDRCSWNECWSEQHSLERAYNYPHVTAVYWSLYRLGRRFRPARVRRHGWRWYLQRAHGTAMGMWEHGGEVFPHEQQRVAGQAWSKVGNGQGTAQWGLMVGSIFESLLRDLLLEGWANEAAGLRRGISLLAAD